MKIIAWSILLVSSQAYAASAAALAVTTALPRNMTIPEQIAIQGIVVAQQQSLLKPELSNLQITNIRKDVGDKVKKGEVLLTLNDVTLKTELQKARAAELEAKVAYEKAKSEWERIQMLSDGSAISVENKKAYEFTMRTAKARWESAQSGVTLAQIALGKTQLKAPFDGYIQERTAQLGAMSGNEGLLVLSQEKEWRPLIHASYQSKLSSKSNIIWDNKKLSLKGISPGANTARQLTLRVQADPTMTVGMSYNGIVSVGEQQGVAVPRQSIIVKDALSAVMTVVNNKVVRVPVTLGPTYQGWTIVKGIQPTMRIITKGMNFVNHGDTVQEVQQ